MTAQAMPHRSPRPWLIAGAILFALALVAGIAAAIVRPASSAASFETVTVRRGPLVAAVESSGSVAAARSLELAFATGGSVAELYVAQGDLVRAGAPLARLDDRAARLDVATAEATLRTAEARLEQARGGNATPEQIAASAASLRTAEANLARVSGSGGSTADIAGAEASLRSAQAQLDELRAGPGADTTASAQARVERARSDLQAQRDGLSAAKTRAEQDVTRQANALRDAQDTYSRLSWENRDLERLPGDLPQERQDAEAAALRAVSSAEASLSQAQVAVEQARQAEGTGITRAEADLRDAEEQLRAVQAGATSYELARAQAGVDQARANLQKLREGGSAAEIAAAQASVDQARANLAQLTAPATTTDLAVAEAGVWQAEQALAQARLRLEQTLLSAPFAGVIGAVSVVQGSIVSNAAPVISLIDRAPLHVDLRLNEADVARLALGQPVELTIDALPEWRADGRVTFIATAADTLNNVVTYRVQVEFADDDPRVKVGMSTNLRIITNELSDALLVPNAALLPRGAGRVVQAPDGAGGVREVAVETGLSDGIQTVIVDGLSEGDVIVAVPNDGPRASSSPFGP